MDSPRMKVNCGVENCTHNREHMCHASMLEVNTSGGGRAHTSQGTCCETFVEE